MASNQKIIVYLEKPFDSISMNFMTYIHKIGIYDVIRLIVGFNLRLELKFNVGCT